MALRFYRNQAEGLLYENRYTDRSKMIAAFLREFGGTVVMYWACNFLFSPISKNKK